MMRFEGWRWPVLRTARPIAILVFDLVATAAALGLALLARFDGRVPEPWQRTALLALPVLVGSRLVALLAAKLHHWSFFMSGLSEGLRLVVAMLAGSAVFVGAGSVLLPTALPRSVWALEFFVATTLAAGMRFGPRVAWAWWRDVARSRGGAARTIIVGVGGAAEILARDICRNRTSPYHLVGFVDEHRHASGIRLAGRPILGELAHLPALIRRYTVTTVLLADPLIEAQTVRDVLDRCGRLRVRFKIVPASFTDVDRRLTAAMLHDLSPADLLPRQEVAFDPAEIRALVEGRCALVTGAGGSIGSEVCRQLACYGASTLVMVDLNENELYLRSRELAEQWPGLRLCVEVADVREPARLMRLGERYRPDYVLHAAAHKHVPLMERAPEEAVKNNVFGTLNVASMARACGATRFLLISTDKAVNPSSVMGASKRVAEMVVNGLSRGASTRMTSVRFGNVLGSAGSVVPLFRQQIARGGPVTVTHPDCTRYFMTIPEAVGLVLLAGLGDYGELCVLEMGEPMRIADLAKHFITMSGHVPDEEIRIVYTGLREGEKLHEELLTEQEEHTLEVRNRIRVARSAAPPRDFEEQLVALRRCADGGDREGVLRVLRLLVPSYRAGPGEAPEAGRAAGQVAHGVAPG